MNISFKIALILTSIALMSAQLRSQDLIVTQDGDSLNCKITKIDANNIYYTFKNNDLILDTLLPLNQVKQRKYNYFQNPVFLENPSIAYPSFRMAINGGWSTRIGKISDAVPRDFRNYIKELKSGGNYGLDLTYFVSEQIGIGLKFQGYRSKNSLENIYITQGNGSTTRGNMSDDITINFIAPALWSRTMSKNGKDALIAGFGLGYLGYKDHAVLINPFTIKGGTIGLGWDFGYDIGISDNFAIGLQLSYLIGTLTQCKLVSGNNTQTIRFEKENYENLSHIDLSVGFRLFK